MGHLMTTACVHHQATGKTNLLALRSRRRIFWSRRSPTPHGSRAEFGLPSHYMGWWSFTARRTTRVFELAKSFSRCAARSKTVAMTIRTGSVREQTNAMGHAVRANYLYAGAADLFMEPVAIVVETA